MRMVRVDSNFQSLTYPVFTFAVACLFAEFPEGLALMRLLKLGAVVKRARVGIRPGYGNYFSLGQGAQAKLNPGDHSRAAE